jgi:toxin ParE1/3/4
MSVRILRRAEADLRRIKDYIEIDNPAAARAIIRRIRERCLDLADFPHQGRPAGGGLRELVIAGTPYLAIYRIAGDEVRILRVLHGRQRRS